MIVSSFLACPENLIGNEYCCHCDVSDTLVHRSLLDLTR